MEHKKYIYAILMAFFLYLIFSVSIYIINNKAAHSFSVELSYIKDIVEDFNNKKETNIEEPENTGIYRVSLKGNEYELKRIGNKFTSKNRYTKYFIIKIPIYEYKNLNEIIVTIGEKRYSIKKEKISTYFTITQTNSHLLIESNQNFNDSPSRLYFFNKIITWKGDKNIVAGGLLSYFWYLPLLLVVCFFLTYRKVIYKIVLKIDNKINYALLNDKITKLISLSLLRNILIFIWAILFLITFYSLFSNFDVTHEGYFLYKHIHSFNESPDLSGISLITYPLGFLFGHSLIGYRIVNLLFITGIAFYYAVSIIKFIIKENIDKNVYYIILFFINIAALGFYSFVGILDYNAFCTIAAVGWVSSVMQYLYYCEKVRQSNYRYIFLILISIFIFLAIISRFTFGIPLLIFTLILLIFLKKYFSVRVIRDSIVIIVPIIILFIMIYLYLSPEALSEIKLWVDFSSNNNRFDDSRSSDVGHLITKYLKDLKYFVIYILKNVFPYLAIYIAFKKILLKIKTKKEYDIFLKYLLVIIFIINNMFDLIKPLYLGNYRHFGGWFSLKSVLAVLMLLIVYNIIKKVSFEKVLFFILISIGLMNSAGSLDNIINMATNSIVLPAGMFIYLIYIKDKTFKKNRLYIFLLVLYLAMNIGYSVIYEQILYFKRNTYWSAQTHYSNYSPYLKNIRIEKDIALHIDKLWELLHEVDFDFNHDRIYAFGDVPGLLSAVGAKSYGEPWVFIENYLSNAYRNSWKKSCVSISTENQTNIRYVYVLNTNIYKIPNEITDCLNSHLKPAVIHPQKHFLGKGTYHWYNKDVIYNITLEGPFETFKNNIELK